MSKKMFELYKMKWNKNFDFKHMNIRIYFLIEIANI